MERWFALVPPEQPAQFQDPPGPDLAGYWWETEHVVCVPLIESRRPGAFTEWLHTLEAKGKMLFVPTVVNAALDARLRRRGYVDAVAMDSPLGPVTGLARLGPLPIWTKLEVV